mmetsp:Transcript_7016/g.10309  ORF Transcript_7016/g.10309 Transcript_7016/m.10309 type:complete len:500 (-) Transcript_7016:37-1536(-)
MTTIETTKAETPLSPSDIITPSTPKSVAEPFPQNPKEDPNKRKSSEKPNAKKAPSKKNKYNKDDFEFGIKLGEGAYSVVELTKFKQTGKKYATKIISKKLILKQQKIKTVKMEKEVLNMMDHPHIISLFCTYQDKENLYFVLELAPGGEMFSILNKFGPLSLQATQFYTAEVISALEYMHSKGIIHRDLKPENIILSRTMHTKVTDFGTAKILSDTHDPAGNMLKGRSGTFVGTAQYVSPEILKTEPVNEACDLWALGCIIYQYLTGNHPFKADSEYLIFQKILDRQFSYPDDFPVVARDLVDKLLQINPSDRLGYGPDGYKKLKAHPFFDGIDFSNLHEQTPPTIIPPEYKEQRNKELEAMRKEHEAEKNNTSLASVVNLKSNISQAEASRWSPFLLRKEAIIYTGQIVKRRHFSSRKRQLILTDKPRLLYVDSIKNVTKGSIVFHPNMRCSKTNVKKFEVKIPGRTYYLEDSNSNAQEWVHHINETIKFLYHNNTDS